MREWTLNRIGISACFVAALTTGGARHAYGGDIGHEQARLLVEQGRILPLADIIDGVGRQVPGQVLEVELDLEDGSYVYELKVLGRDGKVWEVEVEAPTGRIVDIEDDD